ncbi:MAG: UDP-3-O-(3-hydroxymyristoyl)glucosamine N-acyltransferase [Gemmatimonadetes bacterium]|nr:UDP-3-O-(3-hydroxymyristoyl)glucosamine N-acyltransferase [Gemmatimonadota bacterium]
MTAVLPHDAGASGGGTPERRSLTARRIAELTAGELIGDPEVSVGAVAPVERAGPGTVTFLASAKYAAAFAASQASVALVSPELAELPGVATRIVVRNPHEGMLALLPHLYAARRRRPGIDPTARLGRGVQLGAQVEIGPYVVLGDGVVLGDRVTLGAHVVIGDGVTVGADTLLHPHVTVYSGSALGARVIAHAGVRIGSDGFGYVFGDGAHRKIPHVGRCLVEDDVELGANTTVDRGSIDDTVIGAGTKIDNLVQVAHNVRIGRLCLIMSQVGIAGSVRIGDGCVLAGQVGVSGHHVIGDRARLAAQAGVFGDIPAGETWSGYPARPHREALRAQAALFKLPGMIRRLERLVDGDAEREG